MYRNSRSNSSFEWKVIADQEAEEYLLQSFLKKVEEKESKDKKHASNWSQPNRTKIINTTRATSLYVEGKEKDKPKEEVLETTHDKATNIIQGGGENNSGFKKEPKNNTAKGQSSHRDQKVPLRTPRDNPKHQGMNTLPS